MDTKDEEAYAAKIEELFIERPDYNSLKALSSLLKRPVGTLVAQSPGSDPFYAGVESRKAEAEWFEGIWKTYGFRIGIHLRGVHYLLISQENGLVKTFDGMLYGNTDECWMTLAVASRDARLLGLVPIEAFDDRRNSVPIEYLPNFNEPTISVESDAVTIDPPELDRIDHDPPIISQSIEPLYAIGLSRRTLLHPVVRNRPARPLAFCCPVSRAIACSVTLAR